MPATSPMPPPVHNVAVAAESPAVSSIFTLMLASSVDQQQEILIDQLPGWCNKAKNKTTLFKRKRLSGSQASTLRIRTKMSDLYYGNWYKDAFKHATLTIQQSNSDSKGKRGHGLRLTIDRVNANMLSSLNDKKLTKSAIHNTVLQGEFCVSPIKMGRPVEVPIELTRALALHAVIMQVSG
jgi:hypothetical protein